MKYLITQEQATKFLEFDILLCDFEIQVLIKDEMKKGVSKTIEEYRKEEIKRDNKTFNR